MDNRMLVLGVVFLAGLGVALAVASGSDTPEPPTELAFAGELPAIPTGAPGEMHVYKTPTCGCCTAWVDHMEAAGFTVTFTDLPDLGEVKARYGIGNSLASCHTAIIEGYVVEGHVPAATVRRLLEERPRVAGIAVPGMPIGSPGMEGPNARPYDVLAFDGRGGTLHYETVTP